MPKKRKACYQHGRKALTGRLALVRESIHVFMDHMDSLLNRLDESDIALRLTTEGFESRDLSRKEADIALGRVLLDMSLVYSDMQDQIATLADASDDLEDITDDIIRGGVKDIRKKPLKWSEISTLFGADEQEKNCADKVKP